MSGADVVRAFLESMEARNWEGAGARLSPDVEIEWPASGEVFVGPAFLAMQRAYPEGWHIRVLEVAGDERVAARVRVDDDGDIHLCAAFYDVDGGRITAGVEHWVTVGEAVPPAWRSAYAHHPTSREGLPRSLGG